MKKSWISPNYSTSNAFESLSDELICQLYESQEKLISSNASK